MNQNCGHRLTQQRLQKTILDQETHGKHEGLNKHTNDKTRDTCEQ